jgi:hypothetical protein
VKVVAETSALVGASICWKYQEKAQTFIFKHRAYVKCSRLLEACKPTDSLIITKTVEDEAKNALKKAVNRTIHDQPAYNFPTRYSLMVLQHLILNDALDRLDYYVEECSIRFPINRHERDSLITNEIEPFLRDVSKNTLRYIQPSIPSFIDKPLRDELTEKIIQSLPSKGVIYKGMPGDKDLRIMAEATMIYRKFNRKEAVYVASLDNHFKPNPVQIFSWNDSSMHFTGELDSAVRDRIAEKFGFIGEDPDRILPILLKQ